MKDEEVAALRETAARVLGSTPVSFCYLYGSQAAGAARPGSDIDLAVYLDGSVPADGYLETSLVLGSRLSEAGIPRAEIVILNEAPLPLLGRMIQQRIVIYSRDESARVAFESLKYREFLDFDFHARQLDEKFLDDMAEGRR